VVAGSVLRLSALLGALVLAEGRRPAVGEGPPAGEIARLIGQLGSNDYSRRDAASRRLEALGPEALPLLRQAARSDDAEVRRRAQALIAAIEPRYCLAGHEGAVWAVAVSPDGKHIASGGEDGYLRCWDPATGKGEWLVNGHPGGVNAVAFSPDGMRVACGGGYYLGKDFAIRVADTASARFGPELAGHTAEVVAVAFPRGGRLLSGSCDKSIRLWDLESGRELSRFDGHTLTVKALSVSPDGKQFLSAGADATLRLWDLARGKEVRRFSGHDGAVTGVAFSPDGRTFLSGGLDNSVRLWDLTGGRERQRFTGHTRPVQAVAFSPDGKRVLSAGSDRTVRLWDVATGKEVRRFEGHTGVVCAVAFFPDGRRAVSAGADRVVRVWPLP
jgi:WD40 repeat protein